MAKHARIVLDENDMPTLPPAPGSLNDLKLKRARGKGGAADDKLRQTLQRTAMFKQAIASANVQGLGKPKPAHISNATAGLKPDKAAPATASRDKAQSAREQGTVDGISRAQKAANTRRAKRRGAAKQ